MYIHVYLDDNVLFIDFSPPLKVKTKCKDEPGWIPDSPTVALSFNCDPWKINLCWAGGIPSFSSIISLI